LEAQGRELEQMRAGKQRLENELSELLSRNDVAADEHRVRLESLRDEITRKDAEISVSKAHQVRIENEMAALREQREEAREQLAGLEAELKEEKECTANLSELANGRREELTRLEERVEEADERYEEAKWRLGKAQYFERLVRRRKGLVNSLIAALRAKSKSNSALKAGLDGLRTFKATAEANQHKLLARIDKLNAELKEAESVVAKHQGATIVNEELQAAHGKISDLEERLNTQVEIIQTLENDLKAAKAIQHSRDNQATALEELRKELVTRNEIIARLEADADDQQRKLSKLRGSESETMRLKTVEEKDKSLIDTLQREIAQLREALARRDQDDSAGGGAQEDLSEKMKERDSSIARLMGTVKEQETQIGKLKESVDQWKKKYEFLSTEAPDAYQSVAEK
jgi:chromosome segregation ATPase